mgnify:CR=1 FL=1
MPRGKLSLSFLNLVKKGDAAHVDRGGAFGFTFYIIEGLYRRKLLKDLFKMCLGLTNENVFSMF